MREGTMVSLHQMPPAFFQGHHGVKKQQTAIESRAPLETEMVGM